MNPRQARRERREAERKAKKLELKKSRLAEKQLPIPPPGLPASPTTPAPFVGAGHVRPARPEKPLSTPIEIGFVSQSKPSRAEINRANAQLSTGPTSVPGKLASSRNSTKHGLASGELIIPGEDTSAFEALLNDLLAEHQPATPSEELLIQEMAQSNWLTQRAIRFQNSCFTEKGVDQKGLALFLRYQTTHQRAFYKALDTLLQLKKAVGQTEIGFVSQKRPAAAPNIGFVPQGESESTREIGFVSQNGPQDLPEPTIQNAA